MIKAYLILTPHGFIGLGGQITTDMNQALVFWDINEAIHYLSDADTILEMEMKIA